MVGRGKNNKRLQSLLVYLCLLHNTNVNCAQTFKNIQYDFKQIFEYRISVYVIFNSWISNNKLALLLIFFKTFLGWPEWVIFSVHTRQICLYYFGRAPLPVAVVPLPLYRLRRTVCCCSEEIRAAAPLLSATCAAFRRLPSSHDVCVHHSLLDCSEFYCYSQRIFINSFS